MRGDLGIHLFMDQLAYDSDGSRDTPMALLWGIWKLARYESEPFPGWEEAAWRLWNTDVYTTPGAHAVAHGVFLLLTSNTPYVPWGRR